MTMRSLLRKLYQLKTTYIDGDLFISYEKMDAPPAQILA
ncbi:MAG: hypothetical protein ACD_41C00364G0007 [uncultured bacterium]|nr:MAG: hypothetical protein ACD_41C00364G0007 [uncultured bacterium]